MLKLFKPFTFVFVTRVFGFIDLYLSFDSVVKSPGVPWSCSTVTLLAAADAQLLYGTVLGYSCDVQLPSPVLQMFTQDWAEWNSELEFCS
jgi:hypothetical protein